jgi:hypothetical protein
MHNLSLRTALSALAIAGAVSLWAGNAQAIVWDLSGGVAPPGTPAGTSLDFTVGGIKITAAGFTNNGFTTSATLFEKNGGAGEIGLGLTNDPTGDNEITGFNLIRIDFSAAKAAGVTNFDFQFGSTTGTESWAVFASNSPTSGFLQVASGNDELPRTIIGPVSNFYYFKENSATGCPSSTSCNNVLLAEVSGVAAVPEPGTWVMMLLGFLGLGFAFRQSRRKVSFT